MGWEQRGIKGWNGEAGGEGRRRGGESHCCLPPQPTLQIPSHLNCPTELIWEGKKEVFPLPPPVEPLNFPGSTGLRYEAQHVRECLLKGDWLMGGGG